MKLLRRGDDEEVVEEGEGLKLLREGKPETRRQSSLGAHDCDTKEDTGW